MGKETWAITGKQSRLTLDLATSVTGRRMKSDVKALRQGIDIARYRRQIHMARQTRYENIVLRGPRKWGKFV